MLNLSWGICSEEIFSCPVGFSRYSFFSGGFSPDSLVLCVWPFEIQHLRAHIWEREGLKFSFFVAFHDGKSSAFAIFMHEERRWRFFFFDFTEATASGTTSAIGAH